jgi:hypothetical protein
VSVLQKVARIKKRARQILLLEVLRDFPGLTEEELTSALNDWNVLHRRTDQELLYYAEHGSWPGPSDPC